MPPQPVRGAVHRSRTAWIATDTGAVRPRNEDRCCAGAWVADGSDGAWIVPLASDRWLAAVADGMGGMAGGDVASRLALTKLIELIIDTSDWTLALQRQKDITTVFERMTDRFLQIDEILRKEADNDRTLQGMGTTLTVAGALGSDLIVGHVGDSRAYLLHEDKLTQLTTDHTLAQALIDAGVAHPDDPASRSMRHVLTAAVGSLGEQVDPQVQRFKLRGGDKLLLCTDGLTEMVKDETIAQVLSETKSAQDACQDLVDLSLSGGGTDNVTVVLAHFRSTISPR